MSRKCGTGSKMHKLQQYLLMKKESLPSTVTSPASTATPYSQDSPASAAVGAPSVSTGRGHVHDNMSIKTSVSMRHQHTLHVSLGRQHQHALHLSLCHQHQHALHLSLCHQHQHALHLSLCHQHQHALHLSLCHQHQHALHLSLCHQHQPPCISACAASINTPWISTLTSTAQI
ncbi:polyadenylate-binding protein 1-B-like [Coregonus clupeaformis]|uniref:polyadenylate-binding protein 1-B-like n=1 Tax=Coregonus clupeaformis TaxID=59861 RepID=UPI001E1C3C7F|nr:polyadenylate-binding protein 1-B-like [Coregonus clupeaformis]